MNIQQADKDVVQQMLLDYQKQMEADFASLQSKILGAFTPLLSSTTTSTTSTTTVSPLPSTDYTKTYRYPYINYSWKFSQQPIGIAGTITPAKGGIPLLNQSKPSPLLGMSVITKEGLLFLNNQEGVKYGANIKGSGVYPDPNNAVYPREIWVVGYKPNYFIDEKFMEDDVCMADWGGSTNGIRFTNDNDAAHTFLTSKIPFNQFVLFRIRLTAIAGNTSYVNVELWINGTKQTNSIQVQAWFRKYYCASLGTDTNNEYVGYAEFFHTNVLSDNVAASITAELVKEYTIGQPIQLPYADNIAFNVANGQRTVSYKQINSLGFAEDPTKTGVRWISMPSGSPTAGVYLPQYDGKLTVPNNFLGRVEITTVDVKNNYFGIPSTSYWGSL